MSDARIGLCLDPLDVLFFRDGRPFGESFRAEGGLPNPQVLAGALRTAMLSRVNFDFRAFAQQRTGNGRILDVFDKLKAPPEATRCKFRGPWLAMEKGTDIYPLLPTPQILVRAGEDEWERSKPLKQEELPGWTDKLRPLWRTGLSDAKSPGGYLLPSGIEAFLKGGCPIDADFVHSRELYDFDHRTGIAVDSDALTTVKGEIYGIRFLTLKPKFERLSHNLDAARIVLYAEALPQNGHSAMVQGWLDKLPIPFGGEGRYVHSRVVNTVKWPSFGEGDTALWLLATPAIFESPCNLPKVFAPVAAASATPFAISGWDVARNGPRATRFAIPAGAVYFTNTGLLPEHGSLCSNPDRIDEGWGYALRGVWNDA